LSKIDEIVDRHDDLVEWIRMDLWIGPGHTNGYLDSYPFAWVPLGNPSKWIFPFVCIRFSDTPMDDPTSDQVAVQRVHNLVGIRGGSFGS